MSQPFDIAVVGAGPGGLTVAAAAAQFGQRVVLFEHGRMGGDCLNTGCVPSKALLAAGKRAHAIRTAGRFGIHASEPAVDFAEVMAHVRRAIAAIAPHDSQERFEDLGVSVVRATARFIGREMLEAAGTRYSARRMVIATGSRPAIPAIPGLAETPFLTSETVFDNAMLPSHLVIIGGGPIGIEMAQAHRRLGSNVTVIEAADPLTRHDPQLATVVLDQLRAEGIAILARTAIERVSARDGGIAVATREHGTIAGSHLLVAAGRLPNIESLDLAAAGVAFTAKGITVNQALRTSNPRIHAIGDVAGGLQFTHVAAHHASVVIRNALFGLPAKVDRVIPQVTYSDPELAQVGLTEVQARAEHGKHVTVLCWPFRDNDRAVTEYDRDGLVKIIAGRRGRVLGAGIAGTQAGELIQPWVLAMRQGLKVSAMAQLVVPYPTRGDASRRAAVSYFAGAARNSWVRRLIAVVKRIRP